MKQYFNRYHPDILIAVSQGRISPESFILCCLLQNKISLDNNIYRKYYNRNTKITDAELSIYMKDKKGNPASRSKISRLLRELTLAGFIDFSHRTNPKGGRIRTIIFNYYFPHVPDKKENIKQQEQEIGEIK
jgi:predicted transcriptional regulator